MFEFSSKGPEILQLVISNHYLQSHKSRTGGEFQPPNGDLKDSACLDEIMSAAIGRRAFSDIEREVCMRAVVAGFPIVHAWIFANGLSRSEKSTAGERFAASLPSHILAACAPSSGKRGSAPRAASLPTARREIHRARVLRCIDEGVTRVGMRVKLGSLVEWMQKNDRIWFDRQMPYIRPRLLQPGMSPADFLHSLRDLVVVARAKGLGRTGFRQQHLRAALWLWKNDLDWFTAAFPDRRLRASRQGSR
ncbi:MAG: hypothetical protein ABI702_18540 [Burkholderiales bacterium]